ncbi:hypothetical protein PV728_28495 [Streptomyces europaeiscabiei]|uniref:hypothetical protein n=1 Tax=Streptomyces TaxID=1883 RepID=UPI00117DDE63|nr:MULTISPECIES: hypothetical protein [Streptomyces]MDX3634136.1 hypothetical protein [Streptomyces europaeiscabiei]MDX3652016.1 hypothetical protein [Streptomyces europaeiscabiei]
MAPPDRVFNSPQQGASWTAAPAEIASGLVPERAQLDRVHHDAGHDPGSPSSTAPKPGSACTFRLRNSVEGINGYAKDPFYERLEDAGTRRIRGIAAQTLLPAFQLAHANRRELTAWADSIVLHGNRPHRRPTRRRKTKSLGTWTPKGYVTKP